MSTRSAILTLVLITSLHMLVVAQAPESFFPHHTGDMWEYLFYDGWEYDTLKLSVVHDSIAPNGFSHGSIYERFISTPPYLYSPYFWHFIVDTLNQLFEKNFQHGDRDTSKLFRLDAGIRDSWVVYYRQPTGPYEMARITSVYEDTIFNLPSTVKRIVYYAAADSSDTTGLVRYYVELAEGFGIIYMGGGDSFFDAYLRSARINQVVYGDTTIVSVAQEGNDLPNQIQLAQNFPNPFNSSTIIRYSLSATSSVTLKVYNLLGQEVAILVKETKPPGFYAISFDAPHLSSGVYFYRLHTKRKAITNKMLLIR